MILLSLLSQFLSCKKITTFCNYSQLYKYIWIYINDKNFERHQNKIFVNLHFHNISYQFLFIFFFFFLGEGTKKLKGYFCRSISRTHTYISESNAFSVDNQIQSIMKNQGASFIIGYMAYNQGENHIFVFVQSGLSWP